MQSTLLACTEQYVRFRGDSSFKAYLLAIARNLMCDHVRRSGRLPRYVPVEVDALCSGQELACSRMARDRRGAEIRRTLASLPGEYRSVVELVLFCDMTSREVAAKIQINEHTARSRLVRAREALRKRLAAYGNDLELRRRAPASSAA